MFSDKKKLGIFFFSNFRPYKYMSKLKKYNPLKAQKAAHRKALMSAGLYGIHKEKSVPSGKMYKRKERTNKAYLGG